MPPLSLIRVFIIAVLTTALAGCADQAQAQVRTVLSGPIMGTSYQVTVVTQKEIDRSSLKTAVLTAMRAVDERMSTYKANSELSRFNRMHSTGWTEISEPLATVIAEAIGVSELSGGAFDVTVGPLVDLWGFGPAGRVAEPPPAKAIEKALAGTGYRNLQLRREPPAVKKMRPELEVDLSAVAKGYAVDRVCAVLDERGISNYLVDIGGDLRANGANERGTPWIIAIEKPVTGSRSVQRVVKVSGFALATSGDYRNYFEKDGRRYSHTIDPRTGAPIRHRLASVSVASKQAMRADALATALMVLGPDEGMALAEKLDLTVFMIVRDKSGFAERYSQAFRALFVESAGAAIK